MLLTHHARERVIKRLSRKRRTEAIYAALDAFLKHSRRLEVGSTIIFTDGEKSLVCVPLKGELLKKEEIAERVEDIKGEYECVLNLEGLSGARKKPRQFFGKIEGGRYHFYINREKRVLYIGTREPLLVITLRPAKRRERTL
ncbi:hypothetical protein [Palaeococcus ferrophilus]|uniref:hypothetical protein n=1 Tax=Palaeococcus ferrophilus TaxID=83868 RepID=UPI00064E58C7|nr:hypothetical protein [Palaeococcus ferrophilus]